MKNELFYRSFEIDQRAFSEEKREISVSISSETEEVERWFGIEILSHNRGAVDLKRIKTVGAHLFNHDPNRIIGPVKSAQVKNGMGYAVLGYDETDEGETALIRTKNNSLRGISVRYLVREYKELAPGEEYQLATKTVKRKDKPIMIATRWEIVDISSTPVPFDSSVGIGRELTRSLDGIKIERSNFHGMEDINMNRHKPLIGDPDLRERLNVYYKVAKLLGGNELQSRVVDAGLYSGKDGTDSIDETAMARVLNDRLFEIESTAKDHKSLDGRNLTFADISDEDFVRSLTNPLLIAPSMPKKVKHQKKDRARVISFEGVDDKDFYRGLSNPAMLF